MLLLDTDVISELCKACYNKTDLNVSKWLPDLDFTSFYLFLLE
jgi:hypothetical protein